MSAKKILVVEDHEKNRILLRYMLEFYSYEVLEAEDGATSIAMSREHKPDLILMDLQMPVLDGYKAIKTLKNDEETKGIKIIAVTSFAMNDDRAKAIEAGADDYISKPIDTATFPALIRKILGDKT